MDSFYEEMYEYLISEGIEDEEATEVVNYLFEDNIHEHFALTENRGKAFLNMLRAVGYMSGVLKKPGARQAVRQVTKKVQGTPLQGNLLTKKGTAQNFTGGRTPFTSTSPVPAASSKLPQPLRPPAEVPGQMRIPGMSDTAQTLSRITGKPMGPGGMGISMSGSTKGLPRRAPKPEFGPGAVKPTAKPPKPELRPDGVAPKPEFGTPPGLKSKPVPTPRTNKAADAEAALKKTAAMTAPKVDGLPASPVVPKVDRVIDAVKKSALPVGVAGATGLALSGGEGPKKSEDPRRPDGSLPPYTPPRPPADPAPTPAPEAETPKEEPVKRPAKELTSAAKDFDRAFAAARKEGKKEFTWRGKQYNTKYKGE